MGVTMVTCSAADHLGHAASSHFNVVVRDTTPPVLTPGIVAAPAGTFGPPTLFDAADAALQHRPTQLATADLDGDGKLDLVFIENGTSGSATGRILPYVMMQFTVVLGKGNGAFYPPARYVINTPSLRGWGTQGVVIADFNKDGRPDVAVTGAEYEADDSTLDSFVGVSLNVGGGAFGPITRIPAMDVPDSIAVGDVDADGNVDLAVATATGIDVLGGTGLGGFSRLTTLTDVGLYLGERASLTVGDFNGDGRADVATVDSSGNAVIQWIATATGFGAPARFATSSSPIWITSADLNGDGKLDIVTLSGPDTVSSLLGTGNGAFAAHVDLSIDRTVLFQAVLADLNGDGKLDIAATDYYSTSVWVANGTGSGAFSPAQPVEINDFAIGIAAADMNGDGKRDLVVGGWYRPQGTIVLNGFTSTQVVTASGPTPMTTLAPMTTTGFMSPDGSEPVAMAVTVTGSTVTFVEPTAFDLVDGVLPVTCDTPSGSDLALGTTRITCFASDAAGNTGSMAFDVTVVAAPPPPPSATPGHMRGDGFIAASASSVDKPRFTFDIFEAASGADRGRFSVWTAHDSDQDRDARRRPHRHDLFDATSITSVVFIDDPAVTPGRRRTPSIDTMVFRGTGELNDVPGYTFEVTAVDAGEPGKGVDVFTLSVSDATGHVVMSVSGTLTGGNIQSLRLPNRTPLPMFTGGPWPVINAEASSSNGAIVTYALPTAVDGAGAPLAVSCAPASGTQFDLGSTPVSCTATDAGGRTASMHFRVVVADHVAPVFSRVPQNMTVQATSSKGVNLTILPPTATDLVSGAVAVKCSPSLDRRFEVGVTTVTCKARDDAGNDAAVSFTVTVKKK